ncbi:hypothetical protein COCNU_14G006830 [Cocos nucifera]|uniref:Transmembrane protein n=1 Tax=Cocos nucifera TaxID=13894 RepID=A0A8K0ND24_COCNU|nr:hypothetical protein COCNU_14G006830 [Cocos nucifera]
MSARRKRSSHFLCFGAVGPPEKEASVKTAESPARPSGRTDVLAPDARRHRPRRLDRRFLAKIFRSAVFVSSPNRSGRSAKRMAPDDKPAAELSGKSSNGNDRTEDAILSLSSSWLWTSSSSASSSCLSSASSSSFREPEPKPKPELRQKSASPRSESKNPLPPPPSRYCGSATGIFLLLLSLSVMVFCGRLYAILWTSSWLCLVPRRKSDAGLAVGPPGLRRKGLEEDEKKRVVLEGLLERNRRV